MKLRQAAALLPLAGLVLLGGCSTGLGDTSLLHPPKTTGREAEIQSLLSETVDRGYILKYPKTGAYRSAIVTYDLNGDDRDEAIAFCSAPNSELSVEVVVMYDDNGWKISGSFKADFPDVDCVQFADYDKDGTAEILAGFVTEGGQNELRIFDYDSSTHKTGRVEYEASYSGFTVGDYDRDDGREIMLMKLGSVESEAAAVLVDYDGSKLYALSTCRMDPSVTKFEKINSGLISEDTTGVVIDGLVDGVYNTQVLYYNAEKGALTNFPFTTSKKTNPTTRSFAINSEDINDDGFLEIPVINSGNISSESEEVAPVITWNRLSTKTNRLGFELQCVGNYDFGYYFTLPESFVGTTAATVSKDRRTLSIRALENGVPGDVILSFRVFDLGTGDTGDYTTIESYNQYTYTYKIHNADYLYIDEGIIKENFALNNLNA